MIDLLERSVGTRIVFRLDDDSPTKEIQFELTSPSHWAIVEQIYILCTEHETLAAVDVLVLEHDVRSE
jgi:hypothetical protein